MSCSHGECSLPGESGGIQMISEANMKFQMDLCYEGSYDTKWAHNRDNWPKEEGHGKLSPRKWQMSRDVKHE